MSCQVRGIWWRHSSAAISRVEWPLENLRETHHAIHRRHHTLLPLWM